MPLYVFHLRERGDVLIDRDGREFADLAGAATAALRDARSMISSDVLDGHVTLGQHIDVADRHGRLLHTLAFADAITIVPARDESVGLLRGVL